MARFLYGHFNWRLPLGETLRFTDIAFRADYPAGVVKFQLEDQLFCLDIDNDDSAFIHRLAVRRSFAGGSVSTALLNWAVEYARKLEKCYLRLDCAADRPKLRSPQEKRNLSEGLSIAKLINCHYNSIEK